MKNAKLKIKNEHERNDESAVARTLWRDKCPRMAASSPAFALLRRGKHRRVRFAGLCRLHRCLALGGGLESPGKTPTSAVWVRLPPQSVTISVGTGALAQMCPALAVVAGQGA
jgi:hypothetical protein